MGYSCGRKLTVEFLQEIAKKHTSRSEFVFKDSSA